MTDDTWERRRRWRQYWLCCLLSLADIELQRERWLNKEITHPHWSYVEFTCEYFNDCQAENYASLIQEGFISQAEFDCIKDFHEALNGYRPTDSYDHRAILDDPRWGEIVAKGRKSLRFLRALIIDPDEQKIFSSRPYARALSAGDFSWPLSPS
jgi:hypothetical protein